MGGFAAHGKIEIRRHHADHQAGMPIHRHGPAYYRAIRMKPAHPQAVAEDYDVGVAGAVFVGKNVASDHGRHAQHREQLRVHQQAVERFGRGIRFAG